MRAYPHTVFAVLDPTGIENGDFCNNKLIPFLEKNIKEKSDLVHITDNIMENSDGIEKQMQLPILSKYIVLDNHELHSNEYIQKIVDLCKKHDYNLYAVVLNCDHVEDEEAMIDAKIVKNSIATELSRKNIITWDIKPNETDFDILLTDSAYDHTLPSENDYFIISDVNGCWDELYELLCKEGFEIDPFTKKIVSKPSGRNEFIILNGNVIGAGFKNKEVLEFVWANIENRNVSVTFGRNDVLFSEALNWNEQDPEFGYLAKSFTEREKDMYNSHYIKYHTFLSTDYFVVNSSPCLSKYLCKHDPEARAAQIKLNREFKEFENTNDMTFSFPETNDPKVHCFFGDVFVKNPMYEADNRCLINGGCIYGGKLIGVRVSQNRYESISVDSKQELVKEPEFTFVKK